METKTVILRVVKHVFFKDLETAQRFTKLYGGYITHPEEYYFRSHIKKYYDLKENLYMVNVRLSTNEMNEIIKYIGLKTKRWNGHKCYIYE